MARERGELIEAENAVGHAPCPAPAHDRRRSTPHLKLYDGARDTGTP